MKNFAIQFSKNLVQDAYSVQTHNYDWLRYATNRRDRLRQAVKDLIARSCHKIGLVPARYNAAWLAFVLENVDAFADFYDLLGDSYSRELMIKVLEFRILGPRHVKMPLNTDEFWRMYGEVDRKYARKLGTQAVWKKHWRLNEYRISVEGQTLEIVAHPLNIFGTFLLKQYDYNRDGRSIAVKEGDVVIDGGGCYGDTALYFATKAGKPGLVISLEFLPENLAIVSKNLAANPEVAKRIRVLNKALWKASGEEISFESNGPGTRVISGNRGEHPQGVETVAIDDLVEAEKLPKLDFIKMDIEGAELEALKGARETLKKHRPNLAISLYHKKEDFITIPQWVQSLGLEYRFYLDHFTIHAEETVLFATARH